jgi:hypothetical protein
MVYRTGQLLGLLQLLLGRLDSAQVIIDETLAGQRGLGQRREEPFTLATRVLLKLLRGDLGAALRDANEAVEIARGANTPGQELIALVVRILLFVELNCPEQTAGDLRVAQDRLADTGGAFLRAPVASIRGWLELAKGDEDAALAWFATGREEARDSLFHRLLCARFELRGWELADAPSRLGDTARWLMASGLSIGRPSEALASWALARADEGERERSAANRQGRTALNLAEETGDLTTVWRAATIVAKTTDDPAEEADLRARASAIVSGMMASLGDEELKDKFLAQPAVVALDDL